ncbi:MAG TPA: transcription antitermination factor NusB [Flavobacteriales bacterium]|nr:transcription antitermination factor NusB [Flavobacteriales bacterium]
MIGRRHIRLKVMQSLYSYFSIPSNEMSISENEMIKDIRSISELQVIIISFIIELHVYATNFLEENKTKYIPSEEDLNPNIKFLNNRIIIALKEDELLNKKVSRISSFWRKNDLDIIRKVFVEMYKSQQYSDYLNNEKDDLNQDKKFIQIMLNEYILDNEIFHFILQERSIFWTDDLPFISMFVKSQINNMTESNNNSLITDVFKNNDDKKFAVNLFRQTINNADEFEKLIESKVKNWELERISKMDLLLIKMALTEVISFTEIPIKVSFNEYIEISKYYSTQNSKVFINGVLDKIVSQFKREGKVKKVGRGLV